jgi:hypothetical protein
VPIVAPVQTPPVWQTAPAQQARPTPPQFMQVLGIPPPGFAQPRPALQPSPGQQVSPAAPHGSQVAPPSPA